MTQTKDICLLKVFSGPNSGAKITLKTGSYIIGNSTDCEIIFHDKFIAPQHIKLIVTAKGIFIHPLAKPVYIAGKDIGGNDTKLRPYQIVTIGKINFAIGSITQKWPRIRRPKFQKSSVRQKQRGKSNTNKSTSLWGYLLGGLGILLLANILYFQSDITNFIQSTGSTKKLAQETQTTIDKLGFSGLTVEETKNNTLRIRGYVKNEKEKLELIKKIENLGKPVAYRIWIDKELVEHANYISKSYGESDIHFTMKKDGELIAEGYVKNASNWNKAQQTILRDIGGINSIQDAKVDSLQQQLEKFRTYLNKEPFKKRISLAIKEGKITISGELTDEEINRWEKVRNKFFEKHGNIPDLVENLQSPRSRFKLAIRGVSVGKVPFITSKDDKKYLVGSHLGEGYYVKSITSDKILLRHNDIEIPVYFGKKDNDNATDAKQSGRKQP